MIKVEKDFYSQENSFALYEGPYKEEFVICREEFHDSVYGVYGIYFDEIENIHFDFISEFKDFKSNQNEFLKKHIEFLYQTNEKYIKNIRNFINEVQKKLKIPVKERSKIQSTNQKDIIHFTLGKWWQRQHVRFSLFTLLVRCGRIYNGKNFKKCIESDHLSRTKKRIKEFFEGKTWSTGFAPMWVDNDDEFITENKYNEDAMKLLVDNKALAISIISKHLSKKR